MTIWHNSLEQRFSAFPIHQQILMVCNELNRAENLRDDNVEYKRCMERSLELLDYFMADKKGHLLKESLRIRDIIAEAWCMLNGRTEREGRRLENTDR